MNSKLQQALAETDEIEAAEHTADLDAPVPAHVAIGQPGRARSKVLQVRLTPEELVMLERIAERRQLPASTIARGQLLQFIAGENAPHDHLVQLVEAANQIKALADDVRKDLQRPAG